MLPIFAVLLALGSATPLPREWRTFHLGMGKTEFLEAAEAMRAANKSDDARADGATAMVCSAPDPAKTPTEESQLLPRLLESAVSAAGEDTTAVRYFTPKKSVERCTSGDAAEGTKLEGRFLDGVLTMLKVSIPAALTWNDVLVLSTAKYGEPRKTLFTSFWRAPSAKGWEQVQRGAIRGVYWNDGSTAIRLLPPLQHDPENFDGLCLGVAQLTLFDLAAVKDLVALSDAKLPDPKAEHDAALLKTQAF